LKIIMNNDNAKISKISELIPTEILYFKRLMILAYF